MVKTGDQLGQRGSLAGYPGFSPGVCAVVKTGDQFEVPEKTAAQRLHQVPPRSGQRGVLGWMSQGSKLSSSMMN